MEARLPLVLSATALVVAVLGTTPLAAIAQNAAFPPNSVGGSQLKRNAVGPAKIAPNAVRSGHVLDGSLLASDFKPGQIPQGPKGDKGDHGEQGPAGLSEYQIVSAVYDARGTNSVTAEAVCPTGKRVLGGGILSGHGAHSGPYVWRSFPNATGTGWITSAASFPNTGMPGRSVAAYAVCARVS
jgi:hypothetical protein